VPPFIWPAGAQGGTLPRRSGAALSFVSCIRLFDGLVPTPQLARPDNAERRTLAEMMVTPRSSDVWR
jgi:hypothetical protein